MVDELSLLLGSVAWACVFSFLSASLCTGSVCMILGSCHCLVYGSSTFFGDVVLDGFLLFLAGKRRDGG